MEEKKEFQHKLELKSLEKRKNSNFQKISCPNCGQSIPADDINIQDKIAKCRGCHAVFPFQHKLDTLLTTRKPEQTVVRPEGVDLYAYQNELELSLRQNASIVDIFPWVFWPLLPIFFTIAFFNEGFPLVVMLASWMIGIFPIMNLLTFSKHRVYITMDDVYLNIQWRPKKLIKDRRFLVRDIDQVYVKKINAYHSVILMINQPSGQKEVTVLSDISLAKTRFLEQEIEKYLKIEDREVPGEVK